jgi:Ala-tRNA(Pro) deacylase
MNPAGIQSLLAELGISFEYVEHEAVFTTADSSKLEVRMRGALTKQLLLSERKGSRVILAIVMHDKRVDIKTLAAELHALPLDFASPELLMELLRVTPGSVTPLGLIFDASHRIDVIVDEDAWAIGRFQFHPLINTATVVIDQEGFKKFLSHTGHSFTVMKIPKKL